MAKQKGVLGEVISKSAGFLDYDYLSNLHPSILGMRRTFFWEHPIWPGAPLD